MTDKETTQDELPEDTLLRDMEEEAADHIEKLEADNARLRRDKETLLTFAQAIQTWRSDADSYDRECEHPQRNYCEDVELMEKAAGYALRRVAERAALQEPKP